MSQITELFDEKDVKDYNSMFDTVIKDLWEDSNLGKDLPESLTRLQKCLEYNVHVHNKYRGFLVPFVYKCVKPEMSESEYKLAQKIGWAVQIHTALVTLTDDICDDTEVRFQKPSWWYLNKKDMICVNDTFLVEHTVFRILEKYLGDDEPLLYAKITRCLNNIMYQYLLGQSLEMELSKNIDLFSMERYLVFQKTVLGEAFFSAFFEIPLWLAGNSDAGLVKEIKDICDDVGYIFSVRDDLMDSFGDKKEHFGTHDNDIIRGKINWLVVTAKELASEDEWQRLKGNLGKDDKESVENVKRIYEDLGVPERCRKHLKEKQDNLMVKIRKIQERGEKISKPLMAMALAYTNLDE